MDITLKRGKVVICALQGDYGKPRPAVIVQSNPFNETHASIVVCPITSFLLDAPLFRILIQPTAKNGLRCASQMMIDKITALRTEKIVETIGELSIHEIKLMDQSLKLLLQLD